MPVMRYRTRLNKGTPVSLGRFKKRSLIRDTHWRWEGNGLGGHLPTNSIVRGVAGEIG